MARTRTINSRYFLDASPEKVFSYLTEPSNLKRWFLTSARLTPRKDGNYTFTWIGGYSHTGKVLAYNKNSKLSLSWPAFWKSKPMGTTRVSFKLKPKEKGTLLQVTHSGFKKAGDAWVETYADTNSGWAYFLTNLKSVLHTGRDLRRPDDDM